MIGLAFERQAADEWEWLRTHPPAECYATVAGYWQTTMDQFAALGRALAAITDASDPAAGAAFNQALGGFAAADGTFFDSMGSAGPPCGVGPSPSAS